MLKQLPMFSILCLGLAVPAFAQAPSGWQQRFVTNGDVRLEIFQKGNGVPVLMHPSLGRPAQDFEDLGNRVAAAGHHVVLINPRRIGNSTGPTDTITLRDLGTDVWNVADSLGIKRTFILGQNFGNRVSRTVSSLQPDRVIGLMLLAAGGEIEPDKETWAEFERVFDPSLPPERHLQAVYRSFFAPGNDASVWKEGWYSNAAKQQVEATKRTDFSQIYFGGTAPMLVIQGLNDRIAPPQNAWNLANKRPNARLVAFPNMGHAMLPEHPEPIAAAVIDFINSQPETGYGADLYKLVEAYSALGIHRVGTEVDAETINWFEKELERRGGKVVRQKFTFQRFDGASTVILDGAEIPSMPLYYEGIGEVESDAPFVTAVNAMTGDRNSKELLDAIEGAKSSGAKIAVIATENAGGNLATPNRTPQIASGLPVVLVPGRYADKLRTGKVKVKYSAKLADGASYNVVATFGDHSKRKPLVIATPLSGWFECAAERGTGIAVALGLAQRIAANYPVTVVGSPGHELLHHIGLKAFLENNQLDPALVVHLGANVALGMKKDGKMQLAPGITDPRQLKESARTIFVRMDAGVFENLKPLLREADLPAVLNPPQWNGEAALWAEAVKSPLMSFVGVGPEFHTPVDVPAQVTGPELLERVYLSIGKAIDVFLRVNTQ